MTDEQIIKAYERCFTLGFDESTCYECPFYTATAKCTEDLRDSTLDLINRQKAEIVNLKVELKAMRGAANSYKLENERLLQKLQQGAAMSMTVPNTLHHTARIAVQKWTRRNEE